MSVHNVDQNLLLGKVLSIGKRGAKERKPIIDLVLNIGEIERARGARKKTIIGPSLFFF